jgi:hypothetical protein
MVVQEQKYEVNIMGGGALVESKDDDIFKEIHETFGRIRDANFARYTKDMNALGHIPNNAYDHAFSLISAAQKDVVRDDFAFLEDKSKFLGNIKNSRELRFYQMENYWLTLLFNMGRKDPAEMVVFQVLWAAFKDDIRMTCNIDHLERDYQGFNPPAPGGTQGGGSFFSRKKKRKPIEYVIPQDDDQGSPY